MRRRGFILDDSRLGPNLKNSVFYQERFRWKKGELKLSAEMYGRGSFRVSSKVIILDSRERKDRAVRLIPSLIRFQPVSGTT